ncbi:MAG TPA: hypothetical protein VG963_18300 [Polyangiaceae bacterium]|nr:hypothetical protein [Polyangiaceae bacterium]
MSGRIRAMALVACAGIAIWLAALALRTPEPARSGLQLLGLVCSQRRLSEQRNLLSLRVSEPFELQISGEPEAESELRLTRAELSERLSEFNVLHPRCEVSLRDWRIRSAGDAAEWLEGELEFSESQAGDLHAEHRSLRAEFRVRGHEVRLERALVGPPERRLPEARP